MTRSTVLSAVAAATERPLCVALDGTLVKSNTFADSLLLLARSQPVALLTILLQAYRGETWLKARIAATVRLDVEHLPYNQPLLRYLREEHARGRTLYLATSGDRIPALQVAAHLGIFDDVPDGGFDLIQTPPSQQRE